MTSIRVLRPPSSGAATGDHVPGFELARAICLRRRGRPPASGLRGTTLIIGSIWKDANRGFISRIASIDSRLARTSWRFISLPRPCANGLKMPPSPPAQEKKEISLIGQTSGASVYSLMCSSASARMRRNGRRSGAEDVDVVGPSIMPEIPDHLHAGLARRAEHRHALESRSGPASTSIRCQRCRRAPCGCRSAVAARSRCAASSSCRVAAIQVEPLAAGGGASSTRSRRERSS